MDSKCLRLVRICQVLLRFSKENCIIPYKRGLLVYYWCAGFSRALELIIDNKARAFFMLVHNVEGCLKDFVKLDC